MNKWYLVALNIALLFVDPFFFCVNAGSHQWLGYVGAGISVLAFLVSAYAIYLLITESH